MADKKDERPFPRERGGQQGSSTSVYLSSGDAEQLRLVQEELGSSQSEAIRTSIRVYAALITQMKRSRKRN